MASKKEKRMMIEFSLFLGFDNECLTIYISITCKVVIDSLIKN